MQIENLEQINRLLWADYRKFRNVLIYELQEMTILNKNLQLTPEELLQQKMADFSSGAARVELQNISPENLAQEVIKQTCDLKNSIIYSLVPTI